MSSARSYPPWTCPGCGTQHGIWVGSCYKCGTNQPVGYCDELRKKEKENKDKDKK